MKETVLITGGNSFIAKHLISILDKKYAIKLLTRNPKADNEYQWDLEDWILDDNALDNVNHIVHLAGAKLNDGQPMTAEKRQRIYDSRIGAANFLREKLKERNQKLKSFVSASAIGYYGFTDETTEIDENGDKGMGFAATLSDDWEKAADQFKTDEIAEHVSKIRVSLVLGNDGGIFPVYLNTIKSNPEIAMQPNSQAFAWNHIADMAGIFAFAVEHGLDGVFNSVAPEPVSMQDVFKSIANEVLGTNYALNAFKGQHLVAHKITEAGYVFKYPEIKEAIKNIASTL
ncbi:DUF1731 domain-containing protein [Flavobacterium poyangense]|uniref:DUF1731 domain-containing protein n=1 Tax=Flavobacterium poyangense TaxID=2204302 RepID=UPI0014230FA6|nr:DUF1731 domain-containing protein [Flavobacterium sp. JXAS1]